MTPAELPLTTLDWTIFSWINGTAGLVPWWDMLMVAVAEGTPAVMAGVLAALWLWPGVERPVRRQVVLLAVLAQLVALGLGLLPSFLYYRPRPYMVQDVAVLVTARPAPSFPSDHITMHAAVAAVLGGWHRALGVGLWLLTAGAMYARVYVGVHFPADVLAGAVFGGTTGTLAWQARSLLRPLTRRLVRGRRR